MAVPAERPTIRCHESELWIVSKWSDVVCFNIDKPSFLASRAAPDAGPVVFFKDSFTPEAIPQGMADDAMFFIHAAAPVMASRSLLCDTHLPARSYRRFHSTMRQRNFLAMESGADVYAFRHEN